jgi:hypothetical protein
MIRKQTTFFHMENISRNLAIVLFYTMCTLLPVDVLAGDCRIQSARLSLQSSELALPAPSPASKCCPSPFWFQGGGTHSLAGEGAGGANSDEGTDTLVL